MNIFRFVPLFRTRPGPMPRNFLDRMFRNRRNPGSRVVLLGDVLMNLSDWWHVLYHRVPSDGEAHYERDSAGRLESIHYRRP